MANPIYDPNTKSYTAIEKSNPKDDVVVIIGDDKDATTFHPQVKISRWANEVNASLRLIHTNIPGNITWSDDGTKITWIKKQGQNEWKAVFYHRDDLDEGGYEFEIHLPANPPVNYLEFTVNTKDLNWFYQPPLTQQEIDEGALRPENVVGSYAVYHKTKGGMNDAAGMEYKVGKAFHVYRPHVVDANNNETWGTLELDEVNGILRISVDQTWLDNAVYPVVVDPTFGYTGTGNTSNTLAFRSGTDLWTAPNGSGAVLGVAGSLDKISVYLDTTMAGTDAVDVVTRLNRKDSPSSNQHALVKKIERTNLSLTVAAAWYDFTAASEELTADDYVLNVIADPADIVTNNAYVRVYRDTIVGDESYHADSNYSTTNFYTTWRDENPWTPATNLAAPSGVKTSIYATYTASGGGEAPAYKPKNLSLLGVG